MKDLINKLYEIDSESKPAKTLKVSINKGGLKREIDTPYDSNGMDTDTRVYVFTGKSEDMVALDKLLSAIVWCGSVGHSTTVKFNADGDGSIRPRMVFPKIDCKQLFSEEEMRSLGEDNEFSVSSY